MAPGTEPTAQPGEDWVVVACFETAHQAEHLFVKWAEGFARTFAGALGLPWL